MTKQAIKVIVKKQLRISFLCLTVFFFIAYLFGLVSSADLGLHTIRIIYIFGGAVILVFLNSMFIERILIEIFNQTVTENSVEKNQE